MMIGHKIIKSKKPVIFRCLCKKEKSVIFPPNVLGWYTLLISLGPHIFFSKKVYFDALNMRFWVLKSPLHMHVVAKNFSSLIVRSPLVCLCPSERMLWTEDIYIEDVLGRANPTTWLTLMLGHAYSYTSLSCTNGWRLHQFLNWTSVGIWHYAWLDFLRWHPSRRK